MYLVRNFYEGPMNVAESMKYRMPTTCMKVYWWHMCEKAYNVASALLVDLVITITWADNKHI